MNIITNHQYRNMLYGYQLTDKQRAEFDYIEDIDFHYFFEYKGDIYDPDEFMRCSDDLSDWDGVQSDSYFSGIVIKYSNDMEQVKIGRYFT